MKLLVVLLLLVLCNGAFSQGDLREGINKAFDKVFDYYGGSKAIINNNTLAARREVFGNLDKNVVPVLRDTLKEAEQRAPKVLEFIPVPEFRRNNTVRNVTEMAADDLGIGEQFKQLAEKVRNGKLGTIIKVL